MYAHGDSVVEDYLEAYKWVLVAGMNGEDATMPNGRYLKGLLQERMSPEQIAEAQKLAIAFVAEKERANEN